MISDSLKPAQSVILKFIVKKVILCNYKMFRNLEKQNFVKGFENLDSPVFKKVMKNLERVNSFPRNYIKIKYLWDDSESFQK